MTIDSWITRTTQHFLDNEILTARLDTLILLEFVSHKNRAWLLAYSDKMVTSILSGQQLEQLDLLVASRSKREPIAYLTGEKEFYGRTFTVTKDVLVPRPESEAFIDLLTFISENYPLAGKSLIDIGTGSGALAITAKLQFPDLLVTATDISQKALFVAAGNATKFGADIAFLESDLLNKAPTNQNIIFANLPYIPLHYPVNKDVLHEPALAIYSGDDGLDLIRRLFDNASAYLEQDGLIFVESLLEQMHIVHRLADRNSFRHINQQGIVQIFQKKG